MTAAGTAKNSILYFFIFLQFPSCLFSAKFYDARSTYNMRGLFDVNKTSNSSEYAPKRLSAINSPF